MQVLSLLSHTVETLQISEICFIYEDTISMLLALINIGSIVAFNGFITLAVSMFYVAFALSAEMHLWRQMSGKSLRYGPSRLGRASIPTSIFAVGL